MASTEIQVANPATLIKIESFFNDSSYRETTENSANYNTRLCVERRMRMPFLDSQTGVAQNHSNLFMNSRQRLPGLVEGQIYSYPSKRWRKKRRQYLMTFMQPRRKEMESDLDLHTISTVENPAALNEDSKDSMHLKDETAKDAWYYDELDMQDVEGFEDPDPDSDYDYEESYSKRKRRRGGKISRGGGRGRKKTTPAAYDPNFDAEKPFACELCGARYKTRPGLTYHYTHSHKERDDDEDDSSSANNSNSVASSSGGGSSAVPAAASTSSPKPMRDTPVTGGPITMGSIGIMGGGGVIGGSGMSGPGASSSSGAPSEPTPGWNLPNQHQYFHPQQQYHHQALRDSVPRATAAASSGPTRRGRQPNSQQQPALSQLMQDDPNMPSMMGERKKAGAGTSEEGSNSGGGGGGGGGPGVEFDRHKPSTYCDFCLGDATQNKKTGTSEELVSCSDCGRSGHPTCLQFTDNMIISVRKYRWQCIECKCCSLCGNSDNDDQLLFCDDCDRGYHMYCLNPPLTTPPEGSWSCELCLDEFHKK